LVPLDRSKEFRSLPKDWSMLTRYVGSKQSKYSFASEAEVSLLGSSARISESVTTVSSSGFGLILLLGVFISSLRCAKGMLSSIASAMKERKAGN
jgi:hypothetical protein